MVRHLSYPDVPLHELLSRAAGRWPNKDAIIFGNDHITYLALHRAAAAFAGGLHALGLRKGDALGLFTPNCPEYEVAFFGAARLGVPPTPLNPSYREREIQHQLNDTGASAVVVHASLYPLVESARPSLPHLRHIIVIGDKVPDGTVAFHDLLALHTEAPPAELGSDDLAALPFSSGTTGSSRGVMLTQRNLVTNAFQFVEATHSTEQDVILIFLPLYHIYGVALMTTAITSGATQVLLPRFDLTKVVETIVREGVTEAYVVPPVMLALANAPGLGPESFRTLRFLMSAAAPLAPEVGRRVSERLQVPVTQGYGMTEASPLTHMVAVERARASSDDVGVVAADTECRIVDLETGERALPPDEVGEVAIRGPQVMVGYWNAPEETARALRNGWLYTGDVGYEDENGNLHIVDRKKEMIKYNAFSIAPAELEGVLLEHPAVLDCGVTGDSDPEAGEVPHGFVVLRPGADVSPEELQRFVADRVAGYKQIRRIDLVEAIPRTASGKILRRMLKPATEARA